MRPFLTFLCLAFFVTASAQNLVPNPSFEDYLECPFSTAELDNQVINWFTWQESPDFFHPCSNDIDGFAGVPENAWGSQSPASGEAYAGLYTYSFSDPEIREYMAAPLISPLVVGEKYYIMFFASSYDGGVEEESLCATNHVGLRFFLNPDYSQDNPFEADNFAHLDYLEILSDTVNWTLIDGWFTADQAYDWVALGNFFDGANTQIQILNDEDRCFGIYYIENVCVATDPVFCQELLSADQSRFANYNVEIYPNPVSELLNIKSDKQDIIEVQIISSLGQVILQQGFARTAKAMIDVSHISKGLYVVKVFSDGQNHFTSKVLIK